MSKQEKKPEKKEDIPTSETLEQETKLTFNLNPVKEIPSRQYRKGSKYDPILDAFLNQNEMNLVEVQVEEKDANYLRTQLKKRIDSRKLEKKLDVSVANDKCYLEKK